MKKTLRYSSYFCFALVALFSVGRLTNMLQWYSSPTITNYPNINLGDRFFATNLIKPKRFDLICYYSETLEFGKQVWTHRVCGLSGDIVELRNGDLFVNDQNVDKSLTLAHNYLLSKKAFEKIKGTEKILDSLIQYLPNDSVITYISDKVIKDNLIQATRLTLPIDYKDEYISKVYQHDWNQETFGPIVVPHGKYFLLGDNRMNSNDSRYIGFIDSSKYIGTVLGR